MNFINHLSGEVWAFLVLVAGIVVLVLTWHHGQADTAIAGGIIGAAINKFTNKSVTGGGSVDLPENPSQSKLTLETK